MASVVAILSALEPETISLSSQQESRIHFLVRTTAKGLKLLGTQHIGAAARRDSLKTFLSVLSLLIVRRFDSSSSPSLFLRSLSKTFVEFDVMNAVVRQAHYYLSQAVGERKSPLNTCMEAFDVLSSINNFMLVIAQEGDRDPGMLAVIQSGGALEMIIRNPLFVQMRNTNSSSTSSLGETTAPRGYIATLEKMIPYTSVGGAKRNFFFSRDDPVHSLWNTSLKVVCSLVTATKSVMDSGVRKHFLLMASDFVVSHSETMIDSLKACRDFDSSGLTVNSLREGASILSLLSEISKAPHKGDLRQFSPLIQETFLPLAISIVAKLSAFLGASSSSREYFEALAEIDAASGAEDLGATFSPFSHGVSLQNARHEAIRYSHFASSLRLAATRNEFEMSYVSRQSDGQQEEKRSEVELETSARAAMECSFASHMEQAAAECLFFALLLLWDWHPSASSFASFTQQEIRAHDIVKPGSIIAFCPESDNKTESKLFGEVLHCNTVERCYIVRLIGKQYRNAEGLVRENQIVGIEDESKRRAIFDFAPAPETSSEVIESANKTPTLGHLILALRWCHEFCSSNRDGQSNVSQQRFAELLTVFLGLELSILNKISSKNKKSINSQLFDLYGEDTESKTKRSLKSIISESCWQGIQQQLEDELESARNAAQSASSTAMMSLERDPYLGVRSRSGKSPYQQRRLYT